MTNKPYILILEGCIGCGKSTIGNILREQMPNNTLVSLTGMKDKGLDGRDDTFIYHRVMLDSLEICRNMNMNFTFVRSFLSEQVYTSLKYKNYSFQSQFEILLKNLDILAKYYDVYFINLKLEKKDIKQRLDRDKFSYNGFSEKKCIEQMEEYDKQIKFICNNTKNIKCYTMYNEELEATVNTIKTIIEGLIG